MEPVHDVVATLLHHLDPVQGGIEATGRDVEDGDAPVRLVIWLPNGSHRRVLSAASRQKS